MKKNYTLTLLIILVFLSKLNAQTYNYYFGNIHAHSSYSDGNEDSATSHMTRPIQDFLYAKASQHIDFYGISEHNHLSAGLTSPANFHQGMRDADSASDAAFVAMYGMEWGVISNGGHVIVYGYDSLIGWDANDYDVFVEKNDYANLWKKVNEKPGSFAYLAHPQTTDYTNLFSATYSLSADNAIVGLAARSGPAFSTNTTYSNPYTGSYIARYNDALKLGYHLGVGLDHDTHNSVFGRQTAGRLVVLATSLSRTKVLDAIRKMRFYSSDDWNLQVNFTISNLPMGSVFSLAGSPTINVSVTDPDASESVTSIVVYGGVPGSGAAATALKTVTNTSTLSYTHTISNNETYYYYLKITQADGDVVWTSPIWYTRNDAITNNPPTADFTPSATTVCVGDQVTFTDNSTNAPIDWSWNLPGALPSVSSNQSVIASFPTSGTYTVSLTASNIFGSSTQVSKTITVVPIPNVLVSLSTAICVGQTDTLTATGANSYVWTTGDTTATIYVAPLGLTNYSVTGTSNGCSKTVRASVTVQACTGIEVEQKNKIKIFPNPANQFLAIDASLMPGKKTIELHDVLGKLIFSKTITDTSINIDLTPYENGSYFVNVISNSGGSSTEQFIIQRK